MLTDTTPGWFRTFPVTEHCSQMVPRRHLHIVSLFPPSHHMNGGRCENGEGDQGYYPSRRGRDITPRAEVTLLLFLLRVHPW